MAFRLPPHIVKQYSEKKEPFGFNGLGKFTYMRTYSRVKPDGTNECWAETVERVVNGTYSMQKAHVEKNGLGWDEAKATTSAIEMYDRIFNFKFTPPGRGLWTMGTKITEEKGIFAALNNCAFCSTANIAETKSKPFRFLMDMSMLGVGCGFDVKGTNAIMIKALKEWKPLEIDDPDITITYKRNLQREELISMYIDVVVSHRNELIAEVERVLKKDPNSYHVGALRADIAMYNNEIEWIQNRDVRGFTSFSIEDTRESWVESVGKLIESYFDGSYPIIFDYSAIRPAGIPLKTFGGLSSGPIPLIDLHIMIRVVMNRNIGSMITSRTIVDIMNLIGKCVVAGNVRRCLPETTLVHTTEGVMPICKLKRGMKVITMSGSEAIIDVIDQGFQECIEVNTELGSFKATPNHRMAVIRDNAIAFKEVQLLTCNDQLVFSHHVIDGDLPEININELLAWFIGYIQSHGVVRRDRLIIMISDQHKAAYEHLASIVKTDDVFRLAEVTVGVDGSAIIMTIKSAYVISYLRPYMTDIPDSILKGSMRVRIQYLAGLYDVYRSCGRAEIALIANDLSFTEQVQAVYASLGVMTSVVKNTEQTSAGLGYVLKVADSHLTAFKEKIASESFRGGNINVDVCNNNTHNNIITPVKVISVGTNTQMLRTFDISVENTEYFAIGNGLISHNSSEIAHGPSDSTDFINLKNYELYPDRARYGWCSNNSVYGTIGMNYDEIAKRVVDNGEPGIFWLKTAQDYSRMVDPPDFKDHRVMGTNPCGEQSLHDMELCCLCEVYMNNHSDHADFLRTLKFAYLYAKTVTLGDTHWVETNRVLLRNRRIGCSLTGIAQFLVKRSLEDLRVWCDSGYKEIQRYDQIYSDYLAIPRSIKTTSIKPSGCVLPSTTIVMAHEDKKPQIATMYQIFAAAGIDLIKCANVGITNQWFQPMKTLYVATHERKYEKITGLYVNGVAPCLSIPLANGQKFTCTRTHKLLVRRGVDDDNEEWIEAQHIRSGHKIVAFG